MYHPFSHGIAEKTMQYSNHSVILTKTVIYCVLSDMPTKLIPAVRRTQPITISQLLQWLHGKKNNNIILSDDEKTTLNTENRGISKKKSKYIKFKHKWKYIKKHHVTFFFFSWIHILPCRQCWCAKPFFFLFNWNLVFTVSKRNIEIFFLFIKYFYGQYLLRHMAKYTPLARPPQKI